MNFLLVIIFAAAAFYFLNEGEIFISFLAICALVVYLSGGGQEQRQSHYAGSRGSPSSATGGSMTIPPVTQSSVRIQTGWGGLIDGEELVGKRVGAMANFFAYNIRGLLSLFSPANNTKNSKSDGNTITFKIQK